MTTYPLSVKLAFFTVDKNIIEKTCIDCGDIYTVDSRIDWRSKRCPACSAAYSLERSREYNKKKVSEFCVGIMIIDLAEAVITKAIIDARNGDDEAREFLRAKDGAELYLKYAGVEVDDEMRRRLYWMGKKRNVNRKDEWRLNAG